MKKVTVLAAMLALVISPVFAGVAGTIDQDVQKEMDRIKNSGGNGQFVNEINYQKAAPQQTTTTEAMPTGHVGTLSALNIIGGIFEGGLVGTGCGLLGYSQTMNRDNRPLINGAVAGTISGASLSVILSVVEIQSRRTAADYFGYDILGGLGMGAVLGAAGGTISYERTRHLENISEGVGYGVAVGSAAGFILGLVEFLLPESISGGSVIGGTHAYINQLDANTTVLSCNIPY